VVAFLTKREEPKLSNGVTVDLVKIQGLPSSREWMIESLKEVPVNIFTNDEKERLVKEMDKERSSGRKGLREIIEGEMDIIYKRSKNHVRR
jgi:hypothetical protein